jgi:hypothetical protein
MDALFRGLRKYPRHQPSMIVGQPLGWQQSSMIVGQLRWRQFSMRVGGPILGGRLRIVGRRQQWQMMIVDRRLFMMVGGRRLMSVGRQLISVVRRLKSFG